MDGGRQGAARRMVPVVRHRARRADASRPCGSLNRLCAGAARSGVLRRGLDLVICGTAAGRRSAEVGAYYAGPGNKFWRILKETGLTPRQLAPEEFKMLPKFGIGLTDLAKRYSGPDAGLLGGDYDVIGLRRKIESVRPRVLAFNGKKAANELLIGIQEIPHGSTVDYGHHNARIGNTILFVLPSTSGSANKWWDAKKWHNLAELIQDLRAGRGG